MFAYDFMRYAFLASTFIAITCGIVGVYVVARGFSFLAHTLSEIGFAGAAFAVWIGWVPLWGMVLFTLLGSIIGVDREGVIQLVILSLFVLAIIFLVLRQLNYDSFDHVGAISHHINTSLVSVVFLIALALAVSIGAQVVGSLLVFILLTLPSSSARYLGKTIPAMLYWSVGIALVGVWAGLVLGYVTNLPVTFFISIIEVGIYLFVYGVHAIKK